MDSTRKPPIKSKQMFDHAPDPDKGFEITQVVGRIEYDADSDLTAHEQAFLMLARLDQTGTFVWSNGGHKVEVSINYP